MLHQIFVWTRQICDTFHKTALFGPAKSVTPSTKQPCLDSPNLLHLPQNSLVWTHRCHRFGESKKGWFWECVTDLASPKKAVFGVVSQIWRVQKRLFLGRCHRFGESKKGCFWEGVTDLASPKEAVFEKVSQIWRVTKKANFEKVSQIWQVQKIRDFKLCLFFNFV